jgi:hypothetical protein
MERPKWRTERPGNKHPWGRGSLDTNSPRPRLYASVDTTPLLGKVVFRGPLKSPGQSRAARQPQPCRNDTQKRVTRLPQPQVRPTSTPNATLASNPFARAKPRSPSGSPCRRQPRPRRNHPQKRLARLPQPQVRPTITPNTTLASKPCARAKPSPSSGIPRRAPALNPSK